MSVLRIQLTVLELLVVFLYVSRSGLLQQIITGIHLHTEALKCLDNFVDICNDGLFRTFVAFYLCQEVVDYWIINAKLHLLRVNHYKFQFSRMLLVQQRCNDGIQSYRFTLTRGTCNQQVRHLGQVNHKDLVGNGLAECHWQFEIRLLELAAVDDAFH